MILANQDYRTAFLYYSCEIKDRNELIKDDDDDEENDCEQSDLVAIMLNLAFIPEYVAEQFRFRQGFFKVFKPAMLQYKLGLDLLHRLSST
mmetsp:Transcript_42499/g.31129  ORF Transcript_42499/g.31129 Transcript_42499/m.31129 type:complete len:91 (-) Transcript_42499:6-278(-)